MRAAGRRSCSWGRPHLRAAAKQQLRWRGLILQIVFASSVQSGFLPPKRATVDRNRSRTDP
ncbi:hypothetical protein K443DRAFT_101520, partial [Laccaria amethystina LaAM-08-1]